MMGGRATWTLALALLLCASAWAVHYVPPSGRLVINTPVPAVVGQPTTLPLYFSDLGEYYAELLPEPAARAPFSASPHADEASVALTISVWRDGKLLYSRDIAGAMGGERGRTVVLWLDVPRDLPQRRVLEMTLVFRALPAALAGGALRFQLARKLQFPPIRLH